MILYTYFKRVKWSDLPRNAKNGLHTQELGFCICFYFEPSPTKSALTKTLEIICNSLIMIQIWSVKKETEPRNVQNNIWTLGYSHLHYSRRFDLKHKTILIFEFSFKISANMLKMILAPQRPNNLKWELREMSERSRVKGKYLKGEKAGSWEGKRKKR